MTVDPLLGNVRRSVSVLVVGNEGEIYRVVNCRGDTRARHDKSSIDFFILAVKVLTTNHCVCMKCTNVCVIVLLCQAFDIVAHLVTRQFFQLSPLTLQVTVNSCNVSQTLLVIGIEV